jgi:hypothetical protein
MKKLIVFILSVCALHAHSLGQTAAGNKYIGGTLSFTVRDNSATITTMDIVPSAGYFITDKLSAGARLGYSGYSYKVDDTKDSENAFVIGPFLRQHVGMGETFSLFIEENLEFAFGSRTDQTPLLPDIKYSTSDITVSVRTGMIYFPTQKIGIEFGFGMLYYQMEREKEKDSGTTTVKRNNFGLNLNTNSLNFGFRYYL